MAIMMERAGDTTGNPLSGNPLSGSGDQAAKGVEVDVREDGRIVVTFNCTGWLGIRLLAGGSDGPTALLRSSLAPQLHPYIGWQLADVQGNSARLWAFGRIVQAVATSRRPLLLTFHRPPVPAPAWGRMYSEVPRAALARQHSFAVRDSSVRQDIRGLLARSQLADLADAFHLVATRSSATVGGAAEEPMPRTLGLLELRSVLHTLGCDRLCTRTLVELADLQRYLDARHLHQQQRRRLVLPSLVGMEVLQLLQPQEKVEDVARVVRLTYDDFLRVMTRGQLRTWLVGDPQRGAGGKF